MPAKLVHSATDQGGRSQYFVSERTGLNVVIVELEAEGVYGNIIVNTPMVNEEPLSWMVERMIHSGTAAFGKDFVYRLSREVSGAYINSTLSSTHTTYTVTCDTDAGLLALLPPYLDAIYCTQFKKARFEEALTTARTTEEEPDWLSKIYPDSVIYHRDPFPRRCTNPAVTLKDVEQYHKQYYTLANSVIIIGGAVQAQEMIDVLLSLESQLLAASRPGHVVFAGASLTGPPRLIQPELPPLPKSKAHRGKPNSPSNNPAIARKRTNGAPLLRFKSVIEDPLTCAPKIPAVLVTGSLLPAANAAVYDVHIAFQGPDFLTRPRWTAFQLIAQHLCRTYNELVELRQEGNGSTGEADFDVGDSTLYSLNMRPRKYPMAIFSACGVDAEALQDTVTRFPLFVKAVGDDQHPLCASSLESIEVLIHDGWLAHEREYACRAEYDKVTNMAMWATFTDRQSKESLQCFDISASPSKDFQYLKHQQPRFWADMFRRHFRDVAPIIVVEKTDDHILSAPNLCATTSALGYGVNFDGALLREKEWEELMDEEVDKYLISIGI